MKAELQSKIAPPSNRGLAPGDVPGDPTVRKGKTGDQEKVDFKTVLMNANDDMKKKRASVGKGDLSGAKNYDEFLESLNAKRQQEDLPKNALDKHDFLKLFVTQLQQQDPLNPQDGAEMASQLAQFNGLEQMTNVNDTLIRLEKASKDAKNMGFVSYLGKQVGLENGKILFQEGRPSAVNFTLKQPSDHVVVEILDQGGQSLLKQDLGAFTQGTHALKPEALRASPLGEGAPQPLLRDGLYQVKIYQQEDAESAKEVPVVATSYTAVQGVDVSKPDPVFKTALGPVTAKDISILTDDGAL